MRAYTVQRQAEEDRWNGEWIKNIKGTPQKPNPHGPELSIPIRINFDPSPDIEPEPSRPARVEKGPKRMPITKRILEKYGYTEHCEGCRHKRAGLAEARNHSEECRERIE